MLTRMIVDLYAWIIEIALWLGLIGSAVLGFLFVVPAVGDAGWAIEHDLPWRIFGALISAAVAFLLGVIFVGPLVVLVDIRRSVRALELQTTRKHQASESPARDRNPFAIADEG